MMRYRWLKVGLPAFMAGCTNNNINVTVTAAMQTGASSDAGVEGTHTGDPTTGASADATTADAVSTTSGVSTGGDPSATDTTVGTSGDASGDPNTSSGGPVEPPRYAVLNDCNGGGLYIADLEDEWNVTAPPLPAGWGSLGLGVSDQYVYVWLTDNGTIARYGFSSAAWEPYIEGPVAITDKHGWIEWVGGDKLCMAFWGRSELHCHDGASWRMIPLTIQSDWWASWDPETNELYIKPWKNNGFQVVDLDDDTIVRTVVGEAFDDPYHKCIFDYHDGHVYLDRGPNPVRLDSQSGASSELPIPAIGWRGGGVHPLTGELYLVNDLDKQAVAGIQEYDPGSMQTTLLPYMPITYWAQRVVFQAPTGG